MRACVTWMLWLLAAGCGGDDEPPRLPSFSDLGGPRMAHPQLVLVFYGDDPDVDAMTAYSEWLVASSWLDHQCVAGNSARRSAAANVLSGKLQASPASAAVATGRPLASTAIRSTNARR